MRCVRGFNFDKAAGSVITTSVCSFHDFFGKTLKRLFYGQICVTGDGYLFLGSRLGNSILLKYTEKTEDHANPPNNEEDEVQAEHSIHCVLTLKTVLYPCMLACVSVCCLSMLLIFKHEDSLGHCVYVRYLYVFS